MAPPKPKRLQVIDRIITVLESITAGDAYFLTPKQVTRGYTAVPRGFPLYMVMAESGGEIEMHSDNQYAESLYVLIHGSVENMGDVVTEIEHAIRDVRKAIDTDFQPAAGAGSLITLATSIVFDAPPDIYYGPEGQGPFGEFRQLVKITVSGQFGEI